MSIASGFPVPTTGIAIDTNHKKNPVYVIGEQDDDTVRWIAVI